MSPITARGIRPALVPALALYLLATAPLLSAQTGGGSANLRANGPAGSCSSVAGPSLLPVRDALECSPWAGATARMNGISWFGQLGSSAQVFGSTPDAGATADASASTQWTDVLRWTNPLVSEIFFTFAINGSGSADYTGATGASSSFDASWRFNLIDPTGLRGVVGGLSFRDGVGTQGGFVRDVFDQFLDVEVQVDDISSLVFESFLDVHARMFSGTPTAGSTFRGSSNADFATGLVGMAFYDHSLHRVSPGFSFDNGTVLAAQPTFTPEPLTLTLVGTGLLGLAAFRRRSRRRTA